MNASHSNQMQKSAVNYMKLHLNVDFKSNQPKFLSEEIDAVWAENPFQRTDTFLIHRSLLWLNLILTTTETPHYCQQ